MKVYPSLKSAKKEMEKFRDELAELEEKYGIRYDSDDSCVNTYIKVEYTDEEGLKRTLVDFL